MKVERYIFITDVRCAKPLKPIERTALKLVSSQMLPWVEVVEAVRKQQLTLASAEVLAETIALTEPYYITINVN
jgi:hypothetical protein